ncbi:hypothetical protein IJ541_02155 [bacterium]|nr:hypothetical protein [bacterium]
MQVNAVNPQSTFGHRNAQREILENFAKADDMELRRFAIEKASIQVNDKKHNRIQNTILASLPLSVGVAAMLQDPKAIGRISKLKSLTKYGAIGAAALPAALLVFAAESKMVRASENFRNFERNHPLIATALSLTAAGLATVASSMAVLALGGKFGPKLIGQLKKWNVDKAIKESKILNKASEYLAKTPSSIKTIGKWSLKYSPWLLGGVGLVHNMSHNAMRSAAIAQNYVEVKNVQNQVRTALENEAIARKQEA